MFVGRKHGDTLTRVQRASSLSVKAVYVYYPLTSFWRFYGLSDNAELENENGSDSFEF